MSIDTSHTSHTSRTEHRTEHRTDRPGARTAQDDGDRDLRVAWWALTLVPAGFVVAALTGQWLLGLLGYDAGTDRVPAEIALLAGIPALTLLLGPPAAAIGYGRRAVWSGDRRGRVPSVLGAVLGIGLLAANAAAYLWG
jgi:hypothetical protein